MAQKKTSPSQKKPSAPQPEKETLSEHSTRSAFEAVKSQLDALPHSALRQPNFNLQEGALVSISVYGLLHTPERRAPLEALAKTAAVSLDLVGGLATVARAAWFVRHKLDLAEAVHSDASLPAHLVSNAFETRKRMLKVLDYHLDADANAQRLLTSIRAGSGHMDLANDLIALADMYEQHDGALAGDTKSYRAGDVKSARKLADDILAALGGPETPESRSWRNYQARAFVLLEKHHEEAIRVGRFLLWYEGGEELFPTLFSAVRARPAKRAAPASEPAAPAPEGEAKPG